MPEASMHKDYTVQSRKDEVGCTRQLSLMKSKTESKSVNQAADNLFGFCVATSNPRHNATA